jgi:hypothetical protein
MHSAGLAHLVSSDTWNDLDLTPWLKPQLIEADRAALSAGASSIAAANADAVRDLVARGVRFLACRETIGRWAQRLAPHTREAPAVIAARIVKGLHEGTEPVPAMIAATLLAQENGARYVAVA